MHKQTIRIGTRKSQLALWQANDVRRQLQSVHPDIEVELVEMTTEGDRNLLTPLAALGGKGLFLKELEQALLDGRIDLAVHSMKDVTVDLPQGLRIAAICERASPFDAFVSNHYSGIEELPRGARVGTCSLRRSSLLLHHRPDLQVLPLRGNVNSRLAKLDAGEFDATILAAAGLQRLGFSDRIRQVIAESVLLPAVGQGAVGIECRDGDSGIERLLAAIEHRDSALCVKAERACNRRLDGGCHAPVAAYARIGEAGMAVEGRVISTDGKVMLRARAAGRSDDAERLGLHVAEDLLAQGAARILQSGPA